VAVLGFAVWGQWGHWDGHIFSYGSQNYTIAAKDPGFWERGFVRGYVGQKVKHFQINLYVNFGLF